VAADERSTLSGRYFGGVVVFFRVVFLRVVFFLAVVFFDLVVFG
jgi:hypothetical protein